MSEERLVETEYWRLTLEPASERIAGRATVMVYLWNKESNGGHPVALSPMQAIHLATELLSAVKDLKVFE